MNLEPFSLILQKASGLTLRSTGNPAVSNFIEERLRVLGLAQPEEYQQKLEQDPAEVQRLVEAAAVPETWFNRDAIAFETLAKLAKDRLQKNPSPLRILCLPCSTGEEAYSIVLALTNAGLTPEQYVLDAVDISGAALNAAQNAEYKAFAFRKTSEEFRQKYFTAVREDTWKLTAEWKNQVRFKQGNLLQLETVTSGEPYDFVFNRNLLIYFARPDQARGLSHLRQLLKPDGIIFVAAGEGGIFLANGFRTLRIPHAFAFRQAPPRPKPQPPTEGKEGEARSADAAKAGPAREAGEAATGEPVSRPEDPARLAAAEGDAPTPAARVPKPETRAPRPKPEKPAPKPQAQPSKEPPAPRRAASAEDTVSIMEDIKDLADTNELAEAETKLRGLLAGGSSDPDAHYLMGLLQDAQGDTAKAMATYRRVIQLDGNHQEALKQLAQLAEEQGDKAEAERLLNRLARAQKPQLRRQPREGGERPARKDGGERQPRPEGGERQHRSERGHRPPRGAGGERQPRPERGERPARSDSGERPPQSETGEPPARPESGAPE